VVCPASVCEERTTGCVFRGECCHCASVGSVCVCVCVVVKLKACASLCFTDRDEEVL